MSTFVHKPMRTFVLMFPKIMSTNVLKGSPSISCSVLNSRIHSRDLMALDPSVSHVGPPTEQGARRGLAQ